MRRPGRPRPRAYQGQARLAGLPLFLFPSLGPQCHHIFAKEGVEEILNLQPKGAKAKPYQVKQVRRVIPKYKLAEKDNEQ